MKKILLTSILALISIIGYCQYDDYRDATPRIVEEWDFDYFDKIAWLNFTCNTSTTKKFENSNLWFSVTMSGGYPTLTIYDFDNKEDKIQIRKTFYNSDLIEMLPEGMVISDGHYVYFTAVYMKGIGWAVQYATCPLN